jgi:hypothetical protein
VLLADIGGADIAAIVVGVAGIVGGIVGGIVVAWMTNKSQREQRVTDHSHELAVLDREQASGDQRELRNEMLTTAAALAGDLTSAYYRLAQLSEHRATESLEEIHGTLDSATSHLGRVSLIFGPRSPATQAAESAYTNIRTMFQWKLAVVQKREDLNLEGAQRAYEEADTWAGENLAKFKRLAFDDAEAVVRPGSSGEPQPQ